MVSYSFKFGLIAVQLFMLPAVLAQSLQVNTPPSVVVCEPSQIQWSGGMPPYYLSFVPAGQTGATPLKQFPSQSGNTVTWNTDLPIGTLFTIVLRDGTGAVAYSDKVNVQSSPDTSCAKDGAASGGNDITTSNSTTNPGSGAAAAGGNKTGGPSDGANGGGSAAQPSSAPHPTVSSGGTDASPKGQSNDAMYLNNSNPWLVVHLMSLIGVFLF